MPGREPALAEHKCAPAAMTRWALRRLLLLDEPASGLSEQELAELGTLISDVAADACVVLVEHRIDLMDGGLRHDRRARLRQGDHDRSAPGEVLTRGPSSTCLPPEPGAVSGVVVTDISVQPFSEQIAGADPGKSFQADEDEDRRRRPCRRTGASWYSRVPALAGTGLCLASDPARPSAKISGANRPRQASRYKKGLVPGRATARGRRTPSRCCWPSRRARTRPRSGRWGPGFED